MFRNGKTSYLQAFGNFLPNQRLRNSLPTSFLSLVSAPNAIRVSATKPVRVSKESLWIDCRFLALLSLTRSLFLITALLTGFRCWTFDFLNTQGNERFEINPVLRPSRHQPALRKLKFWAAVPPVRKTESLFNQKKTTKTTQNTTRYHPHSPIYSSKIKQLFFPSTLVLATGQNLPLYSIQINIDTHQQILLKTSKSH